MADDSIYRDFYAAQDWVEAWWAVIEPWLISDTSLRIYVALSSAFILYVALRSAFRAKEKLTELKKESLDFTFPGPKPELEETLDRRRKALQKRAREIWIPYYWSFGILLIAGLVIPTTAFALFCLHYDWFDSLHVAFIVIPEQTSISAIDGLALVNFLINQILHGALFDTFEVFEWNWSQYIHNRENIFFSSIVIGYRAVVSGFAIAFVIAIYQLLRIKKVFDIKIEEQLDQFRRNAAAKKAL
ncbi:MAG: hypothetical protein Q7S99_06735 [Parvibaculum sp.]|mgnify:CR=1 FL=1|nr:hypothetical protein [Parvibaculum sp.]